MIDLIYFSPCGLTLKIADAVTQSMVRNLGPVRVKKYNFTNKEVRQHPLSIPSDHVLVLACPTYAGRVPNKIMPDIKENVKGQGGKCIIISTFGGRAYDESLKELYQLMSDNNFSVIGAAAFVCQHAMASGLASSRPDETDIQEAYEFGTACAREVNNPNAEPATFLAGGPGPYYTPLKEDGSKANFLKAKPLYRGTCTACGLCVSSCPMEVLSIIDGDIKIDQAGTCIKCHACVNNCPENNLFFDDADLASHIKMLESTYGKMRPDNEFFI